MVAAKANQVTVLEFFVDVLIEGHHELARLPRLSLVMA